MLTENEIIRARSAEKHGGHCWRKVFNEKDEYCFKTGCRKCQERKE
jgi:hypothetical protein